MEDGGVGEWLGFIGSVDVGATELGKQYEAFVQQCPTSKVVLAGYSQGAMVVHRNLHTLAASPNLAAALLVADGDRLPEDPTLNLGTASGIPERGKGAAQDWPIMAHAPADAATAIGAARSACATSATPSATTTPMPTTPKRPMRGGCPSTPATGRQRDWTGPRRCTVLLGPATTSARDAAAGRHSRSRPLHVPDAGRFEIAARAIHSTTALAASRYGGAVRRGWVAAAGSRCAAALVERKIATA